MKRNDNLRTLSWEHHDGLVVAFRLNQGVKNGVARATLREYIVHVWDNALQHHFWQEEKTINDILQKNGEGRKLKRQMLDDHTWFRDMVSGFKNKNGQDSQIEQFADSLNQHIRFEERELFPFVEVHSSAQELEKIGEFLQGEHRAACNDWEPRFWKKESDIS